MARTGQRTLCLVPTRALLHQWRDEIRRFYPGAVGCLGDGERDVQPITVSTFESAVRRMPKLGNQFGMLVVDEVHHFGAGIKDEALEMCTAALRLGLTATPPHDEALNRLDDLLGPVVYRSTVADLAGKWLSEFDLVVLRLTLSPEERARYASDYREFQEVNRRFRKLHPGGTWQEFVRAASQSPEGRAALVAWRRSRRLLGYTEAKQKAVGQLLRQHRDSRVIVFTASNEAAYAIAREYLVMPITCEISRRERNQALAAFRAGALKALVSARVLNEGIDVPDADVASGLRTRASASTRVQSVPGNRGLLDARLPGEKTHELEARQHRAADPVHRREALLRGAGLPAGGRSDSLQAAHRRETGVGATSGDAEVVTLRTIQPRTLRETF
jgi:superfamily II DNA or RNA helicase